jgi:hypothetical protein
MPLPILRFLRCAIFDLASVELRLRRCHHALGKSAKVFERRRLGLGFPQASMREPDCEGEFRQKIHAFYSIPQ